MKKSDPNAKRPKPSFALALSALQGSGKLMQREIAGLSDLSPDQWGEFQLAWPRLDATRRVDALQVMFDLEDDQPNYSFLPVYRLGMSDKDETVRLFSVKAVGSFDDDPRLIAPLIHLLREDPAPYVRVAAAHALGKYLELGALDELDPAQHKLVYAALIAAHATAPRNSLLQSTALAALGFENNDEVRALVLDAHSSEVEQMRISALIAMGNSGEDKTYGTLVIGDLRSDSAKVRQMAVVASGALFLEDAVDDLGKLIHDDDVDVREMAVDALGEIATDDARAYLKLATKGKDEDIAMRAEEALEEAEMLGNVRKMMDQVDDLN
jgi:HEAT repeat protein